jgi:hypothetical protein
MSDGVEVVTGVPTGRQLEDLFDDRIALCTSAEWRRPVRPARRSWAAPT